MWSEVLERFEQHAPVGVMARVALEQALPATWIDEVFEASRQRQYPRELMMSSVVELMMLVSLGLPRRCIRRARNDCRRCAISGARPCPDTPWSSTIPTKPWSRTLWRARMHTRASIPWRGRWWPRHRPVKCGWPTAISVPARCYRAGSRRGGLHRARAWQLARSGPLRNGRAGLVEQPAARSHGRADCHLERDGAYSPSLKRHYYRRTGESRGWPWY